ncbi:MAG TPA: ATP-dependent DNA ligase [Gordonia sp. (in: high G+C Gram-positive bacteria)]|uniref:ATP-dependent DNA ligase n=1 Tax=unclassified Gordonia (in: high G+C Gram-positive bacteria) TaxID=2657482 RepID=UPI000FABBB27|nr:MULTISPECIES: ATP-dependent DNA ligase [unclassified Gordonia (in: high G+C Gram-positive bacteria)]RUP38389.1 MAG: ATP-dependent DNA ligase [Gordonia sp. (in: high G+C Gram-positive bacteria)]HNP58277.1 ATP-dependent DNA ligase [Gordonia sp. (in: high G+C Gram-positive bacteria)]HRC52526.1 ATP-dependent DNA ligase [Gordonia sp. (in: high G+C Gram-positive bacteria)]
MRGLLLADVVATSNLVAATRSRTAKTAAIAELLGRAVDEEIAPVTAWCSGELLQGRLGVGWAGLQKLSRQAPSSTASLTVAGVDAGFTRLAGISGAGSALLRAEEVGALFAAATDAEQIFLRGLLSGELRQGALAGVVTDAVAVAAGLPKEMVRRAVMLSGSLPTTARLALTEGAAGLRGLGIVVGRPLEPMLATPASSAQEVWDELGPQVVVDAKYDGARIQVHRRGTEISVFTRSLREITGAVPEVVRLVAELDCETIILDGETLAITDDGRPRPFQDTMSGFSAAGRESDDGGVLRPYFFDCLHLDGADLIDEPLVDRLAALEAVAPGLRIPSTTVTSADEIGAVFDRVVADGHEGVMVKSPSGVYAAGRRGRSWQKIKPVHTFDLVVLAAEWGSGRRRGWLSNIHLGARDPAGGPPIMVGKTFKGMTDELLAWQTTTFPQYETSREDYTVYVRPELVVEIAVDGVQRSTRYPGGLALRFARVVRYRPDKTPDQADTIGDLARLGA